MLVFSKVIDHLISAILLKTNFHVADTSIHQEEICLGFKTNYLSNNLVTSVSVSLKTFCSTRRKEVCRIFYARFDPQSVTENESYNGNTN